MAASCRPLHAVLPAWGRAMHSAAAGSYCLCWPRSVPWGFSRVRPRLCCRSWRGFKCLRAFRLFRGEAIVLEYERLRSQEGWFLSSCRQWHVFFYFVGNGMFVSEGNKQCMHTRSVLANCLSAPLQSGAAVSAALVYSLPHVQCLSACLHNNGAGSMPFTSSPL